MSVFAKSLKTFETDILGEKKQLKINNAVWLYLESDFDLTQQAYFDAQDSSPDLTAGKFVASVLKANGIETTLEELMLNTSPVDLQEFMWAYNDVVNADLEKAVDERLGKLNEKEKKTKK